MSGNPSTLSGAHLAVIALISLIVYSMTMPTTIGLEDAGLFQMVCHLGGISHPPGYPLFTNLCQLVVPMFPPGVIAGNLMSAVFASLTCAVFFSCVLRLTHDLLTAYVAAFAYAFSATFWSQAIIIEVYTFAVLGFVVCWRVLLAYVDSTDVRYLYLAAFVYGLCLTNHWPLMILSTPALVLVLAPRVDEVFLLLKEIKTWLIAVFLFALGLTPYLTILLKTDATIALLGDINTVEHLAQYISRSAYSDHHLAAGTPDRVQYAFWLLQESGRQFGWLGVPFILTGLIAGYRNLPKSITVMLVLTYLASTFGLNQLLNFSFEFLWQAVFKPYPVISYLALAFWFALGFSFIASYLQHQSRHLKFLPAALALVCLSSIALTNLAENNRRNMSWVQDYGESLLASLPADAVFFASDDFEIGVLGYLQKVMGVRPDVELRNWENLVFDNRLVSPFSTEQAQRDAMIDYMSKNTRPVFASSVPIGPRELRGAYFRYTPSAPTSAVRNASMDNFLDYFLNLYTSDLITDPHELHYAHQRLADFTRQYVTLALSGINLTDKEMTRLEQMQSTYAGKLATLEVLLPLNNPGAKDALMDMVTGAFRQIPASASRESRALLHEYAGRVSMLEPADVSHATGQFEQSVASYPVDSNTSLCPLSILYDRTAELQKLEQLRARYPGISCH